MKREHKGRGIRFWYLGDDTPGPLGETSSQLLSIGLETQDDGAQPVVAYSANGQPIKYLSAHSKGRRTDGIEYFEARIPDISPGDVIRYFVFVKVASRSIPGGRQLLRFKESLQSGGDIPTFTFVSQASKKSFVKGMVRRKNGEPIPGVIVRVHEKEFGKQSKHLAEGKTDKEGAYYIEYASSVVKPHLFVSVHSTEEDENKKPLSSILKTKASPREIISFTVDEGIYRNLTDFGRLDQLLHAYFRVVSEKLSEEEVQIIAAESAATISDINTYHRSKRLAQNLGETLEVCYALCQLSQQEDLSDLFSQGGHTAVKRRLKRVLDANRVAGAAAQKAGDVIDTLHVKHIEQIARSEEGIGGLLDVAGISKFKQRITIAELHLEHGFDDAFWAVAEKQKMDVKTIAKLKKTVQLSGLTLGNSALLRSLSRQRRIQSPRDVARLTSGEWQNQLKQAGETNPNTIREQTKKLMRRAEETFPTTAVARDMRALGEQKEIWQFVDKHDGFEFGRSHILSFLKRDDIRIVERERAKIKPELEALQRVFRLGSKVERYGEMRALLKGGFDSAYKITRAPKKEFIRQILKFLPGSDNKEKESNATIIYQRAYQRAGMAVGVMSVGIDFKLMPGNIRGFGDLWGRFEVPDPDAYQDDPELGPRIAEYRELFGAIDFCACKPCESVLSQSAYLVDLLQWLDQRVILEPLIKGDRRPDIAQIKLNCSNTDAEVPYIDLMNEILENQIAPDNVIRNTPPDFSAKELLAQPVYLNRTAYEKLRLETPPRFSGLDLWEQYACQFLGHLKVTRLEVIKVFKPDKTLEMAMLNGLTRAELAFVTRDVNFGARDGSYNGSWTGRGNYVVSRFLSTTGLEYDSLLDLLHARAANYRRQIILEYDPSLVAEPEQADRCNVGQWRLRKNDRSPTKTDYLSLHRFLTVWRASGWTMLELDKSVMARSGAGAVTPNWKRALPDLAALHRLQQLTGKGVLPLLALWGDMDPEEDHANAQPKRGSLYDQVFQDKSMDEATVAVFALTSADANHIRDYRPEIQGALRVTGPELRILEMREFGVVAEQGDADPGPTINLSNLSALYRQALLAQALDIPVLECLAWQRVIPHNPFGDPARAVAFWETFLAISVSGIETDDALYYFHHDSAAVERLEPDEATVARQLWSVRHALQDVPGGGDEGLASELPVREFLARNPAGTNSVDQMLAVIAKTSTQTLVEQEALVDIHLAGFLDAADAKQKLVHDGLVDERERWDYVESAAGRMQLESGLRKDLAHARIDVAIHQPVIDLAHTPPQVADEPAAVLLLEQQQMRLAVDVPEARRNLVEGGGRISVKERRFAYLNGNLLRYGVRITELEKSLSGIIELDVSIVNLLLVDMEYGGLSLAEIFLDPDFIGGVEATTAPATTGIDHDLNGDD